MLILGIDPGTAHCGWVLWETELQGGCVVVSGDDTVDAMLLRINLVHSLDPSTVVVIERVQSTGQAGADLLQTAEIVGRLQQRALDRGHRVALVYRREVLAALDVTGKGSRDTLVSQRLKEMFPAGKGTKANPGPLYGLSGHAWQALAVAVALLHLDRAGGA